MHAHAQHARAARQPASRATAWFVMRTCSSFRSVFVFFFFIYLSQHQKHRRILSSVGRKEQDRSATTNDSVAVDADAAPAAAALVRIGSEASDLLS